MTLPLIASAEVVTIAWLDSRSEITAFTSDRIGTKLMTPDSAAWPQIRVTRVGGTVDEPWRDLPRVQLEFWGESESEDHPTAETDIDLLARTCVALIHTFHGAFGGGYVHSALISVGPFPSPDPLTNRSRQIVEVTFDLEHP